MAQIRDISFVRLLVRGWIMILGGRFVISVFVALSL